jgi:flavin-dependent thymidylate synthase
VNDDYDNAITDKEMLEAQRKTEMMTWADGAMYRSEAMPADAVVGPRVHLLSMTPDPLGVIAAGAMMYEGRVARSLADVTHADRQKYAADLMQTHLKAPFELVDFHFMIEGVTRAFTHQMVRQRTAVFMQESLRFAVKENLDAETPLPPSLAGLADDDPKVRVWRRAINASQDHYEALVSAGVPAEDARGLLPHQTTTRLHYKTNLRNLLEHAGNRLCTQAQFEWRAVWLQIVQAIKDYRPNGHRELDEPMGTWVDHLDESDGWQYEALSQIFRPVCYLTGKCEFKASFDRSCTIRDRVEANHAIGRGSAGWAEEYDVVEGNPIVVGAGPRSVMLDEKERQVFIGAIQPAEWMFDPAAARR